MNVQTLHSLAASAGGLLRPVVRRRALGRRIAFCAIATHDFLPWALVLFDSLARHHPRAERLLLYVPRADEPSEAPPLPGIRVVMPRDLIDPASEERLRARYTIAELCFALKPRLLRYALDRLGDRAIYLDTDVDVRGPLEEALIALEFAGAVLTPHLDAPLPMDGRLPSDVTILRAGIFNLGFAAVSQRDEARRLLDWWDARCQRWGFVTPELGYQGDQKWMDLAPSLFAGVHVLRDRGSNVGYWNLHSRPISVDAGGLRAGGARVAFVHFSGLDPDRPQVLSRFQNRLREADLAPLMALAQDFAARIVAARERVPALPHAASTPEAAPRTAGGDESMPDDAYRAGISVDRTRLGSLETGEAIALRVVLVNESSHSWRVAPSSAGRGGIALSYHLRDANGEMLAWSNPRVFLPRDVAPGECVEVLVPIRLLPQPGRYVLEFDVVHEHVAWFSERGNPTLWYPVAVGVFEPQEPAK